MAFFHHGKLAQENSVEGYSLDLLHKSGCTVCPLRQQWSVLQHPDMQPYGSDNPIIYAIGEAPGADEDAKGIPFVGQAGRVLHFRIPPEWEGKIRWNNCVRTRPPENRTPTQMEIECCRPAIKADIEATKPKVIFGFGNVPLKWALNQTRITNWCGRRIPISIGNHTCWFFPMLHPSYVLRTRKWTPYSTDEYGSDEEFKFALDLKAAFEFASGDIPEPIIHSVEEAMSGLDWVTGKGVGDLKRVEEHLRAAAADKVVGIDYETNTLRPYDKGAKILTIAVARKDVSLAFPLHHRGAGWSESTLGELEELWDEFLYVAECRKVAHHLPFEMEWSASRYSRGCLRAGSWGDSESQAYILDERRGMHSLDVLCQQYFGLNLKAISNLDTKHLNETPINQVLTYNAVDAKYHRLLYLVQGQELKRKNLVEVYQEQLRRIPTMVLTQLKGVPIDQKVVQQFHNQYCKKLNEVEQEIDSSAEGKAFIKLTGHPYRPGAPHDVTKMVRAILKRRDIENVNEKTLNKIDHPVIERTIRWRKSNKILSTYVKPVMPPSPHLFPDGRVHPVISLTQTRTWRTSSEDPNIQNWPKRRTKEVRRIVAPGPGYKVVSFDYGQIQARNVAMESLDQALIKAFWDRYDIHADWMERIARAYPSWMPKGADRKAYRHRAKNEFVFPSFFGAQPKSLARYLGVPEEVIAKQHVKFWNMFPSIKDWHERVLEHYKKHGYATGLTGFRRHAPASPNEIINAPIQADEALIVCDAMSRLSETGDEYLQANLEVHDDLTFILPEKRVDDLSEKIIEAMITVPFEWANVVPIVVERSIGDNWADMQTAGTFSSDEWRKDDARRERKRSTARANNRESCQVDQ